jgi:hypothetical protein
VRAALAACVGFILAFGAIAGSMSHTEAWADLVTDQQNGTISTLSRQLRDRLSHQEPYLLRRFPRDTVGQGVMWDLVRHSLDIRVARNDPYLGQAHGPPRNRRISTLLVIPHASARPRRGERIAWTRPTAAILILLAQQQASLCAALRRDPPTVTGTGQRMLKTLPLRNGYFDLSLLAAFAKHQLRCAQVRNTSLPAFLHIRAIKTSSLTESQVVAFQDASNADDDTTFDVYLLRPSAP